MNTLRMNRSVISDPAGLIIDGTGRSITISGNNTVRVLSVNSGAALRLNHLTPAQYQVERRN